MFRVSTAPIIRVLKTVTAASDTSHNIGTATSLQRGQFGTELLNLAMLEGGSCTHIVTGTGDSVYSFLYS